jgi:hypothetical protein
MDEQDISATTYHPDPEINAVIALDAINAEVLDLRAGLPPRAWRCPSCESEHSRGPLTNGRQHRCLRCGYIGEGGRLADESERAHADAPIPEPTSVEEIKETVRALGHAVRALNEIALLIHACPIRSCPLASEIAERGLREISDEMLGEPDTLAHYSGVLREAQASVDRIGVPFEDRLDAATGQGTR